MDCLLFKTILISSSQKHPNRRHEGDNTVLHYLPVTHGLSTGVPLEAPRNGSRSSDPGAPPLPANMDEKTVSTDGEAVSSKHRLGELIEHTEPLG